MSNSAAAQQLASKRKVLSKATVNTADILGLPKVALSHILGVSPSTVTRLYANTYQLTPEKKEWDFAVLLVRLFRSLDSIVGGAGDDARRWLNSENLGLAGKKPVELIQTTEGLVRVVTYLDASRGVV